MKKILCLALSAVTLVSCEFVTKREQELTAKNDSLTIALSEKNMALDQAMQSIADIQEGFRAINEAEGRVTIQSQGSEGVTDAERMREDILFIQQKMEENRKQIEQLQKKLKAGGAETASLRKVLANLQKELDAKVASITALQNELAQKNIRIAELDSAVVMLTGDVNALQQVTDVQQEVIEQQVVQLNTAWYVYGTAKELKEQNILRGGKVLSSTDFNKDYFTEIDIRHVKDIKTYSKSAKLLTTHPDNSYMLTKDGNGYYELHISNPSRFWSVSKYLVMLVK